MPKSDIPKLVVYNLACLTIGAYGVLTLSNRFSRDQSLLEERLSAVTPALFIAIFGVAFTVQTARTYSNQGPLQFIVFAATVALGIGSLCLISSPFLR